ncbi:MAG: 50S ribosomal protein L13 [Candidatus Levybacteria bacterium]|nr:50S ribosomal protein L13 [Candidatus Levybacteria bacterium]
MKDMTVSTKLSDIKRSWHLFDAKGKILGRISSEIAKALIGKSKPYFVNNLDCGDYVVVINASEIKVSGKKEIQKKYSRHSGYPGGYKEETLVELRQRNPTEIIRFAVLGMLPQNKLRAKMLARLFIFKDEEHSYKDKFKSQNSKIKTKAKTEEKKA